MSSLRVRAVAAALLVAVVIGLQARAFSRRIPTVDAQQFDAHAVELRRDSAWRYGFSSTIHGAVLTRTPLAGASPAQPTAEDDEVAACMRGELAALPRRAALEALFYASLVAVALFGVPWAWRRARRSGDSRSRRATVAGLLAAALGILAVSPQTLLGYGGSAFSTWVGPFAMSYSGPYPHVTWISGETVSYRTFLEILLLPALQLTRTVGRGLGYVLPLSGGFGDLIARPLHSTCLLAVFFLAAFVPAYLLAWPRPRP